MSREQPAPDYHEIKQAQLGHADLRSTSIYTKPDIEAAGDSFRDTMNKAASGE